ncbi:MAG: protein YgfX [Halioglobus sp.]
MSVRYFNSPTLRLTIAESRLRTALHSTLCLIALYALYSICARGYPFLVVALSIIACISLSLLRRNPMRGAELCWCQGRWTLERDDVIKDISPSKGSVALLWFIYIGFTDIAEGSAGHIWLYADSVPKHQLRQLRVRLTLLH